LPRALAATRLLDRRHFHAFTGEVALGLLSRAAACSFGELTPSAVSSVVLEEGWVEVPTGGPVPADHVAHSVYETINLVRALGLMAVDGKWPDRSYELNVAGRPTALAALRARAVGPRT